MCHTTHPDLPGNAVPSPSPPIMVILFTHIHVVNFYRNILKIYISYVHAMTMGKKTIEPEVVRHKQVSLVTINFVSRKIE